MSLTTQQAFDLVAKMKQVVEGWNQWQPTPEQKIMYVGRGVKPITEPVKEVLIEVGEAFRTEDIARGARELALAVDNLFAEFSRWLNDYKVAPEAIPPYGADEMWDAYRTVLTIANRRVPPAPPHAVEMRAQGDTVNTIAMRFGWFTPEGHPDLARVNKELNARVDYKEGIDEREYDPETWVHPRLKKQAEEIDRLFEERNERLRVEIASERPKLADRKPCEETWDELAQLPGITLRQISLMKRVTESEARTKLDELGYVKTADGFKRAGFTGRVPRGTAEPEWLEENNAHDEVGDDLDARILACAEDGMKPKNIADLLSGARGYAVTPQKVAQVIRRAKEKQEA